MFVRSSLPALQLPDTDFSSFVLARVRQLPSKAALVDADAGAQITYGQWTQAIDEPESLRVAWHA